MAEPMPPAKAKGGSFLSRMSPKQKRVLLVAGLAVLLALFYFIMRSRNEPEVGTGAGETEAERLQHERLENTFPTAFSYPGGTPGGGASEGVMGEPGFPGAEGLEGREGPEGPSGPEGPEGRAPTGPEGPNTNAQRRKSGRGKHGGGHGTRGEGKGKGGKGKGKGRGKGAPKPPKTHAGSHHRR